MSHKSGCLFWNIYFRSTKMAPLFGDSMLNESTEEKAKVYSTSKTVMGFKTIFVFYWISKKKRSMCVLGKPVFLMLTKR